MRRKNGFTLIELLVVLGILSVLIGILLPTLAGARKKARSVACKAQLQNIGAAFQMYLNANKNRYPYSGPLPSAIPSGSDQKPLPELLASYVSNQMKVFHCPADETLFQDEGISYFYYSEIGEYPMKDTFFYKMFHSASLVPILWDAANFHGGQLPYNWLFADGHVDNFLSDAQAP
ncbi:MAG: type II secretion system protein [Phycisphaerales bacterium]|jgi:prepilin-type N-terminal cleavage/methylation domain-containing protein/prepilin-type processing-associated H-X9-DG protein|nr:type II secretion system protein [Phycisphaerales bacterium]